MSYDIIGDIHGHADALISLLRMLGYHARGGAWRHPDRRAIFVGDFIDRGPGQIETIRIVRSMIDSGTALAVMGNHEFNAIAWHTPDAASPGEYLRRRSAKNLGQHEAFLIETANNLTLHQEMVDWFLTLPLWLEVPGLRVVHACWHPTYMSELTPLLQPGNKLDMKVVEAASRRASQTFCAIEAILKGPEVRLPGGLQFPQGGNMRHDARTRWWDATATTFRQSAIVDSNTQHLLPDTLVPQEVRFGYESDMPVFFGHYWMTGEPRLLASRVACVDYSAGKGGPLVAYRWDGERELDARHFVSSR